MSNIRILGQMESTLLQSFLRAANLKRWLAKPDCPAVIKECKALFDKIYAPKVPDSDVGDSSLQDDVADTEHVAGSDATLDALLQDRKGKVITRARLRHNGIIYSTSTTHLGNSLVQFYPNGDTALSPVPGCIKYIFSERDKLYLGVQRQLPLDSPISDPFALYPQFPAKMYSSHISPSLERVEVGWIYSHYARWEMPAERAVVLSLSRVCHIFRFPVFSCLLFSTGMNIVNVSSVHV